MIAGVRGDSLGHDRRKGELGFCHRLALTLGMAEILTLGDGFGLRDFSGRVIHDDFAELAVLLGVDRQEQLAVFDLVLRRDRLAGRRRRGETRSERHLRRGQRLRELGVFLVSAVGTQDAASCQQTRDRQRQDVLD
jgi:hypothetical protein